MLTYSRWRPDGGYDYFQSSRTSAPLGNDLGVPRLETVGGIGVPSVEAGRAVPSGSVHVGDGPVAVGVIAPMKSGRIGAVSFLADMPPWLAFATGAAAMGFVWLMWGREK